MAEDNVDRYEIKLIDVPGDERSRLAAELRDYLLDEDPDLVVEQVRADSRTQDFGATLLLTAGPPVALALARGLQKWLAARNTAAVTVTFSETSDKKGLKSTESKEIRVTNLSGRRAADLARELTDMREE